jgi:hypothetical protein
VSSSHVPLWRIRIVDFTPENRRLKLILRQETASRPEEKPDKGLLGFSGAASTSLRFREQSGYREKNKSCDQS